MNSTKPFFEHFARAASWLPLGVQSGMQLGIPPPRQPINAEHKKRLHLIVETDDISVLKLIHAALPLGCSLRVHAPDVLVGDTCAPIGISYPHPSPDSTPTLTTRQREVLNYLLEGLSNKAIARKLELSHFTVRNHVSQLMRLLGVATRKEAVALFANFSESG